MWIPTFFLDFRRWIERNGSSCKVHIPASNNGLEAGSRTHVFFLVFLGSQVAVSGFWECFPKRVTYCITSHVEFLTVMGLWLKFADADNFHQLQKGKKNLKPNTLLAILSAARFPSFFLGTQHHTAVVIFEKLLKLEVASQNEAKEAHSQRLILESSGPLARLVFV